VNENGHAFENGRSPKKAGVKLTARIKPATPRAIYPFHSIPESFIDDGGGLDVRTGGDGKVYGTTCTYPIDLKPRIL
jgi:hypothetical protein